MTDHWVQAAKAEMERRVEAEADLAKLRGAALEVVRACYATEPNNQIPWQEVEYLQDLLEAAEQKAEGGE